MGVQKDSDYTPVLGEKQSRTSSRAGQPVLRPQRWALVAG
jgi:hypothetical protein